MDSFIFGCAESSLLCGLSSSVSEGWGWGATLVAKQRLFVAVASLIAEHRIWGTWASVVAACELSSCGSWALEHSLSNCGAGA